MKLRQFVTIFAGALAIASAANADTVVLKNGDRLTGTVEVSDGKDVTLKTDFAGEIKIQWAAVQELKTTNRFTSSRRTRKPSAAP